LPVLFIGVEEHQMPASTENITVTFKNIVCLWTDFDEYPLTFAELPIIMDGCFVVTFQEQSSN
jgi:hypothetical protein